MHLKRGMAQKYSDDGAAAPSWKCDARLSNISAEENESKIVLLKSKRNGRPNSISVLWPQYAATRQNVASNRTRAAKIVRGAVCRKYQTYHRRPSTGNQRAQARSRARSGTGGGARRGRRLVRSLRAIISPQRKIHHALNLRLGAASKEISIILSPSRNEVPS